ncbi:hypothetical protein VNI00_000846 [Paramarasmius palmivorus]|uniref:PIN-like protein n=1 Tax=Paramarasmius palmivorus TaxID=297713 RepID=A0AAW0E9Q9_9AGAR
MVPTYFDPRSWNIAQEELTLEVMRVVLVIGLFVIGVELPKNYMSKHMKGLLVMVIPTMAIGWVIIAATTIGTDELLAAFAAGQ